MNRRRPRQVLECASLLVFWRFGNGGEPTESVRGLALSKTPPRDPQVHGPNERCQSRGASMIALSFSSSCPSSSRIQWLGFEDEDEQEDDLVHGPDTRPKWPPVMGIVGNV